jgi:hypothetical protein
MSCVFQNIDPPPPSPPGECVPTALGAGGGHIHRGWRGGWGVNILEDARHSSVLYLYRILFARDGFRYSAEERAHSKAFEVYRRVNSEARNGMELQEKNVFCNKILLHKTELRAYFRVRNASEFREFAYIFVPRNGILSCFLFRGMV